MASFNFALLGFLFLVCLRGYGQGTLSVTISTPQSIVCPGSMMGFTATVSGASGAVSYQWYSNGVAISGAAGSTYAFTANTNGVQIMCSVSTAAQTSVASNTITVGLLGTLPSTPSTPLGPQSLCASEAPVTYTTSALNVVKYIWILNEAQLLDSGNSVTITPVAGVNALTVESVGCNGLYNTQSATIFIYDTAIAQTPRVDLENISVTNDEDVLKFCPGQVGLADLEEDGTASSYNWWIKPVTAGTITLSSTTDSAYITMDSSASDTIIVYVSANGCNGTSGVDSVIRTFNRIVGPVVQNPYSDTACTGDYFYTYSGTSTIVGSWEWNVHSSQLVQSGVSPTPPFSFKQAGLDTLTLINAGVCNVTSADFIVNVLGPITGLTTLSGPSTLCEGQPLTQYKDSTVNAWNGTVWSISPVTAGSVTTTGQVQISPSYSGSATIQAIAIGCQIVPIGGSSTKKITAKSTVTVEPSKTFTVSLSPMSTQFCSNESFTFTATPNLQATGYQWQLNGSPVPGATANAFTIPATSASQLQSVMVTADAAFNTVCSTDTVVTASALDVAFTQVPYQPASVTITDGFTAVGTQSTFTFTATPIMGGNRPGYQWQMNGINIPDATGSTYSASSTAVKGQSIGVVLTSSDGCASPAIACQTVNLNW